MIKIVTIKIDKDYERAESVGLSGKFQVIDITGIDEYGNEYDLIEKIGNENFYDDDYEVLDDLKTKYVTEYDFSNCNIE